MAFVGRSPVRTTQAAPLSFLQRESTPLRVTATPSTAPHEAMAASLQAHIDELVQKNRNCEHDIKRLKQSLTDEKEKNSEIAERFRIKSTQEREECWEACSSFLAAHRIVHLRTRIEWEKAQIKLAQESAEDRAERLAIVQRDYRLTLFQAKELQSDIRIAELEEEIEDLKECTREDEEDYKTLATAFEQEMTKVISEHQAALKSLKEVKSELAKTQAEAKRLTKESSTSKAASDANSSKIERLTLQLNGAKDTVSELEGTTSELKRANADLKRQLRKWESLENKSDVEVEEERKRRIELEIETTNLQKRVAELEKEIQRVGGKSDADKERQRVAKLREENTRMAVVADDAQKIAIEAREDLDKLQQQLDAAESLIEELRSKSSHVSNDIPLDDDEVEADEPKARRSRKTASNSTKEKNKPRAGKGKAKAVVEEAPEQEELATDEVSSDEESKKPMRAQRSARKRKNQSPAFSDQELDPPASQPAGKKGKAPVKIKPAKDNAENDDDVVEQMQKRPKSKENKPPKTSQEKTRKPSASQETRGKEDEPEAHPKRKKKKLFPTVEETFPWDTLPKGDGTLNIPTTLSPVKDTQAVPARSMFGKMGSAFGLR